MDSVPVRVKTAQPVAPRSASTQAVPPRHSPKKVRKPLFIVLGIVLLVLAGAVAVWAMRQMGSTAAIDTSTYQGVFVSSGQVYFGKLEKLNDGYMKLTDAFYIKLSPATKGSEQGTAAEPNELIKYGTGDEQLYGPRDAVTINNDQILYFVNMDENGKVVQAIKKYHDQQKK